MRAPNTMSNKRKTAVTITSAKQLSINKEIDFGPSILDQMRVCYESVRILGVTADIASKMEDTLMGNRIVKECLFEVRALQDEHRRLRAIFEGVEPTGEQA